MLKIYRKLVKHFQCHPPANDTTLRRDSSAGWLSHPNQETPITRTMSESPFAWMGLFQTEYLRNVDINTNLLCHKFKHGGITFVEEERDES